MDRGTLTALRTTLAPMSKAAWGTGGVYLRNKIWWIYYPIDGRSRYESSKSEDKAAALRLLRKRLRGSAEEIGRVANVGELLDLLVRDYRINSKSVEWVEMVVKTHLRPHFKSRKANSIGSDDLDAYIQERREKGRANATINRELSLLRRAFKLGAKAKPAKCRPLVPHDKLKENNVRQGFFERVEFETLRAELPEHIRPVITFAYFTGCRRGEILNLKWSQVDLDQQIARLEPGTTKNKEARSIPLHKELLVTLAELKTQRDKLWPKCPWVFSRHGFKILSFKNAWERACKRSGVNRLFHDLRRTGVRNLVRAGVSEKIAMKISGHKTRAVFDRYQIVRESDLHEAMRKLEESE